jgi:ATP-binding protein involved in chromosome partitioning
LSNQANKIIAVASGKGGVGKSTIAVNLALALASTGAQVGLLDADIYGPSQASMLATKGQRPAMLEGKMLPFSKHGIQSISMGNLIDEYAPVIWRGPMLGKIMQQLLHETHWQNLDYLIIDLPPGTGDVHISLCQKVPVTGAIIVTTPQDLALLDVRRACEMFKKLSVPLLGVVENMSSHHCVQCGHSQALFGEGGGQKIADEYQMSLLGQLPFEASLQEMTDKGGAFILTVPQHEVTKIFQKIAQKLVNILTKINLPKAFPKIVVESKIAKDSI